MCILLSAFCWSTLSFLSCLCLLFNAPCSDTTHSLSIGSWEQASQPSYPTGISPQLHMLPGAQLGFLMTVSMSGWVNIDVLLSVSYGAPLVLLFSIVTSKFKRCVCICAQTWTHTGWARILCPSYLWYFMATSYSLVPTLLSLQVIPNIQSLPTEKLAACIQVSCFLLAKPLFTLSCPLIERCLLSIWGPNCYRLDKTRSMELVQGCRDSVQKQASGKKIPSAKVLLLMLQILFH